MSDFDRYMVKVTPDLDVGAAEHWVRSVNILLKTNLLHGLHFDSQTACKLMVDLAGQIAPSNRTLFYLMDEETRIFQLEDARGFVDSIPATLRHGNPLVGMTVEKRQPLRIKDPDTPDLLALARATGCPNALSIPVSVMNEVRGVLQLYSQVPAAFPDETVRLLWILALQIEGLLARLQQEPAGIGRETDPFTGLMKRSSFEREMARELSRSRRSDRPFSLVLAAIDRYEHLLEGFSRLEGDVLIREFASLFRRAGRRMDFIARHDDPTIALLLPEVDEPHASLFASRVMRMVRSAELPGVPGRPLDKISVSIGIASFPALVTTSDLLANAEKCLEEARSTGGDRVVCASTLLPAAGPEPVSFDLGKLLGSVANHFRYDGLVGHLVEFYGRLLGADRVSIQTFDPADSSLSFFQGRGFQGFEGDIRREPSGAEKSISGKSILSRRPLVVEDIDQSIPDRPRRHLNYHGPSFMTIPLFHNGVPVGVINFSNRKQDGPFTRKDLDAFGPHIPLMAELLAVGKRFAEIQESFFHRTADILLGVAESKTPYLAGHGERVARLTSQLAAGVGIPLQEAVLLTESARYHDLGRIAVDEAVLSKKDPLEESEREQIRRHPDWSFRILQSLPGVKVDWEAIRTHHERMDGKGYPSHLMGEEIPLGGRVLAVADAFDAMTHPRPYREAMKKEEALKLLDAGKGKQWDGRVVKALRGMAIAG